MSATTYISWEYANKQPSSDNNNLCLNSYISKFRSCAPPESGSKTADPIITHLPAHCLLLPCHFLSQPRDCFLPSSPSWKLVSELVSNISVEGAIQWRPECKKPWTPLESVQDLVTRILQASIDTVAGLQRDTSKTLHPVMLMTRKEVIFTRDELERMVKMNIKQGREDRTYRNIVCMIQRRYGLRNLDEALSENLQDSPEGWVVRFLRPLNLIFAEDMEVARRAFVLLLTEYWEFTENDSEAVFLGELTKSDHLLKRLRRWGLKNRLEIVKIDGRELCAVCLENYEEESEVTRMQCTHCFHKDCILEWLTKQRTCPLCRSKFRVVGK